MAKIPIREAVAHKFEGKPPAGFRTWREFGESIELYPQINADLLYHGDDDPFHLTLPILEIGRVSENGLVYDEELVSAIEQQLPGMSGNRGHLTDEQFWHEYPVSSVVWVGHRRENNVTYAKGYIPPSPERDDLRRKVANGGQGLPYFGMIVAYAALNGANMLGGFPKCLLATVPPFDVKQNKFRIAETEMSMFAPSTTIRKAARFRRNETAAAVPASAVDFLAFFNGMFG